MNIVLGSASKRKIQTTHQVVSEFIQNIHVQGSDVSSGVSETPYDQETKKGAHNRAVQARIQRPGNDMYIGLESGLVQRYGDLYEEAWACVITKDESIYFGYSSGLKVPNVLVGEMKKGTPHAELMKKFDTQLGIKTKDTWGSYSGKLISRDISLQEALRNAMIQIIAGEKSFYQMDI